MKNLGHTMCPICQSSLVRRLEYGLPSYPNSILDSIQDGFRQSVATEDCHTSDSKLTFENTLPVRNAGCYIVYDEQNRFEDRECQVCSTRWCSNDGQLVHQVLHYPASWISLTAKIRNVLQNLQSKPVTGEKKYWHELPDQWNLKGTAKKPPHFKTKGIRKLIGGVTRDGDPKEDISQGDECNEDDVDDVITKVGWDAIAWYLSFRYGSNWGIYVTQEGVRHLSNTLKKFMEGRNITLEYSDIKFISYRMLYFHELFHFKLDYFALQLEQSEQKPLKLSYSKWARKQKHDHSVVEEVAANLFACKATAVAYASMHTQSPKHIVDEKMLYDFMTTMDGLVPDAYEVSGKTLEVCADQLIAQLVVVNSSSIAYGNIEHRQKLIDPFEIQSITDQVCYPIHEPSFHELKLVPTYNVGTVKWHALQARMPEDRRVCERFVLKFCKGRLLRETDHKYYEIDNKEEVKFPNKHHKDILPYELENIRRTAGYENREYFRERSNTHKFKRNCPRPVELPAL